MTYESRRPTVMVVENDRTVLELLQIRLDVAGYNTCMARTGPMALETLRAFRPAALVLDVNLPGMNGFEVLEGLNPKHERLAFPTLIMGRSWGPDDIQRAIRLGARDCVTKPFGAAEILERVARLLRKPAPSTPPAPPRRGEALMV